MRNVLRGFLVASALAGASVAMAQRTPEAKLGQANVYTGEVRDASHALRTITNLRTGKVHYVNGADTRGTCEAVFDSLSAPAQDPNLGFNGSAAIQDPADPNLVIHQCEYPVTGTIVGFYFAGMGETGAGPAYSWPDFRDIGFDPLRLDGAAPDALTQICQVDGTFIYDSADVNGPTIIIGGAEWNDYNNNGVFETTGDLIGLGFDPNLAPGAYEYSAPLPDPNLQISVYGEGVFVYDFQNPGLFEGVFMAGGNPRNLFANAYSDTNCETPNDLLTAGSTHVTGFDPVVDPNAADDIWVFHSSTDPNGVDPGADGDPNSISYTDIWNSPTGSFWVSYDGFRIMATTHTYRLYAAAGGELCPGDCDGDGQRNITDLGLLLGGFNQSPGPCDTNGDNATNITDLGDLLSNFNTACP